MKKLLFVILFIFVIFLIISLVAFLFTSIYVLLILAIIFFVVSILLGAFFAFFNKLKSIFEKTKVSKYYKQKDEKEKELKQLEMLFFKRGISEETFKKKKEILDQAIFELESKIRVAQISELTTEQELKEKINLITKKYLSKNMSENLFQELYSKHKIELETLQSKQINDDLDRKIKRELLNLKRQKTKKN